MTNHKFDQQNPNFPVKCEVLKLNIQAELEYSRTIEVKRGNNYYTRRIKSKVPKPTGRLTIDFKAKVDAELPLNCGFTDGINTFRSISKNEITIWGLPTTQFQIPEYLILVYSMSPL